MFALSNLLAKEFCFLNFFPSCFLLESSFNWDSVCGLFSKKSMEFGMKVSLKNNPMLKWASINADFFGSKIHSRTCLNYPVILWNFNLYFITFEKVLLWWCKKVEKAVSFGKLGYHLTSFFIKSFDRLKILKTLFNLRHLIVWKWLRYFFVP